MPQKICNRLLLQIFDTHKRWTTNFICFKPIVSGSIHYWLHVIFLSKFGYAFGTLPFICSLIFVTPFCADIYGISIITTDFISILNCIMKIVSVNSYCGTCQFKLKWTDYETRVSNVSDVHSSRFISSNYLQFCNA